jgi:DNA-binding NtrC family response regulator
MKKNKTLPAVEQGSALLRGRKISPCRILAVDQNSDLRLLYTDALAGAGCHVDVAKDASSAWDVLQARRYHLLLTENDPPHLTGDRLIKKLRSARMDLPVVMTTARLPLHEPAQIPWDHFVATLRKPFALEALMEMLQNVLREKVPVWKQPLPKRRSPILGRTLFIAPASLCENPS